MTSPAPDLNMMMEILLDKDDSFKDEILLPDGYQNGEETWFPNTDLLNQYLELDDPQFNFIDAQNNLDAIPSSSSDSGLSSALSLTAEQQLSPMLAIDDEQIEISNDNFNSSKTFIDLHPLDSPNGSIVSSSVDSPMISAINSNMGSPAQTEIIEEMDIEKTITATNDCSNVLENIITPKLIGVIKEEPVTEIDQTPKPVVIKQDSPINVRNLTCGKRNIKQIIRVTPVGSGNPRSILLPVSLKDMKDVRTIKIINAAQARNLKGFKINQSNVISKAIPVNIKHEDSSSEKSQSSDDGGAETDSPYPPLKLSTEEKRLLQKEGITLPSHYPLTKHEERELKRIRRKIRNKISAQDSRKRKKEYVDGLEDRVKQCTEENMTLLKRIKALQTQNQSLAGQLKRLQALIQKGNKSAQPTTCLMVLLLSLALVALPNLRPHSNNPNEISREKEQPEKMSHSNAHSRQLLFTNHLMEEDLPYSDELLQEVEGLLDHDYSPSMVQVPLCKRARSDNDQPSKYSPSVEHIGGTLSQCAFSDIKLSKKYIEPPLDDVWPPPNPGGVQSMKTVDKLEALTNELKINISDVDGTRTVVLKVPQ